MSGITWLYFCTVGGSRNTLSNIFVIVVMSMTVTIQRWAERKRQLCADRQQEEHTSKSHDINHPDKTLRLTQIESQREKEIRSKWLKEQGDEKQTTHTLACLFKIFNKCQSNYQSCKPDSGFWCAFRFLMKFDVFDPAFFIVHLVIFLFGPSQVSNLCQVFWGRVSQVKS